MPRTLHSAMSIALGVVALTACSAAEASDSPADPRAITVTASDTRSDLSATTAPAGTITFGIVNTGTRVTEFSVYADGDRIVSEVENLTPGLKRELQVELTEPGTFTTACKPGMLGDGLRSELTITGKAAKRSADAKVARAIAKELYPTARLPWETIEPVESFGDLDPRIDGREDVIEDGREFTGYHRLEKDLWVDRLQAEAADGAGRGPEAAPGGLVGGGPHRQPEDTGEAYGLPASGLTLTIGFGPSLFDHRFDLAARRPAALEELAGVPRRPARPRPFRR